MPFDPKDPDTKAAIASAVSDALEKAKSDHENDVAGLKAKVEELARKEREARKRLREKDEVDPAEMERLEAELEKAQGKASEFEKQLKTLQKEHEKTKASYESESAFTRQLLIENGLTESLTANGVKDAALLKAAKAMMAPLAEISVEGDERIAKVGDKPLSEFIKEWAGSDEAKPFIAAGANMGGGSAGSGANPPKGKSITREQFEGMPQVERANFVKEGGKIVDAA